jgi:hypothetical protein
MTREKSLECFAILLALVLFLAGQLPAQNRNAGEIRGTITDSSGARVPGTTVKITETMTGVTHQVTSDAAGTYDANYLEPGTYKLTFEKPGFGALVRTGIELHVQIITINAQLRVGASTQTVSVTAPAPLVQTESSERSGVVTGATVLALPLVGNDASVLVELEPGANYGMARQLGNVTGAGGGDAGFNGNGALLGNNLVDGGVGTLPQSYNPDYLKPATSSIAEIDVSDSNFSAMYGMGTDVYNVITKSGTNRFHGEAFEFDQNTDYSARNFFATGVSPLIWNQFGGSVGGPIKRDKAFFFFTYQGLRSTSPSAVIDTVPTAAELAGDFSAAGLPQIFNPATTTPVNGQTVRTAFPGNIIPKADLDPVAQALAAYYPAPNAPGVVNNYLINAPTADSQNLFDAKVDLNISSSNRVTATFISARNYNHFTNPFPGPACGGNCGVLYQHQPQATFNDIWTLRSNLVNEFRFSFLRELVPWTDPSQGLGIPAKVGLLNPGFDEFPNISIGGAVTSSIDGETRFDLRDNAFVPTDNITWVKGRHIIKMGGEVDRFQVNNQQPWQDEGDFCFNGIFTRNPAVAGTGLGMADFLLGLPDTYSLDLAPDVGQRSTVGQAFVQDDFKISPNLTLNLGLRYTYQGGWSEAFNRLTDFDPTITNPVTNTSGGIWFAPQDGRTALEASHAALFAPRLGFAYAVRPKLVIRGAYGVFFLPWPADEFSNGNPAGYAISNYLTSTDQITPIFSLGPNNYFGVPQGPPPYVVPTAAIRTPGILNGEAISYMPYHIPVAYSQQYHVGFQKEFGSELMIDASYVGSKGTHLAYDTDLDQVPESLLGPGNLQSLRPYPQYMGISTQLFDGESIYQSFQVSIRKTMSHGLQFLANYTFGREWSNSDVNHNMGLGFFQNAYDQRSTYGLSDMDVPNRISGDFVWQVPVGIGKRYLSNARGVTDAFLGGWQASSIFQAESGVPFTATVAGANLSGALAGTWLPNRIGNGNLSNPTIADWFDTSAFVPAAPYTFGNEGRNVLRGPDFSDLDFSLQKSFRLGMLGEAGSFLIRMDAYDFFNHPNFGLPVASIGSLTAGEVLSSTTNRSIQLGARLIF